MQDRTPTAVLDRLRDLKTQAKNRRDLKRYERAARLAQDAIDLARSEQETSTVADYTAQLASELADIYGLLGGIERRWGLDLSDLAERRQHLQASVRAYDQGYLFESDSRYGIVSSYCLVNRLIGRILVSPQLLSSSPGDSGPTDVDAVGERLDVRNELTLAAARIEEQLPERRADYWALADLALIDLLLGRREPAQAFARFIAESPPDFAYTSTLETLRCLILVGVDRASVLSEAVSLLERRSQQ